MKRQTLPWLLGIFLVGSVGTGCGGDKKLTPTAMGGSGGISIPGSGGAGGGSTGGRIGTGGNAAGGSGGGVATGGSGAIDGGVEAGVEVGAAGAGGGGAGGGGGEGGTGGAPIAGQGGGGAGGVGTGGAGGAGGAGTGGAGTGGAGTGGAGTGGAGGTGGSVDTGPVVDTADNRVNVTACSQVNCPTLTNVTNACSGVGSACSSETTTVGGAIVTNYCHANSVTRVGTSMDLSGPDHLVSVRVNKSDGSHCYTVDMFSTLNSNLEQWTYKNPAGAVIGNAEWNSTTQLITISCNGTNYVLDKDLDCSFDEGEPECTPGNCDP